MYIDAHGEQRRACPATTMTASGEVDGNYIARRDAVSLVQMHWSQTGTGGR